VAHVGRFNRQRPAPAPRAQPDGDGQRRHHPEHGGAVGPHVGDGGSVEAVVADHGGQRQDPGGEGQGGDVDLVEGVDPVDGGHPVAATGPPQILDHRGGDGKGDGHGLEGTGRRRRRRRQERSGMQGRGYRPGGACQNP
jgi:hypothetical protein